MATALHVVFGGGQVGSRLARTLAERGLRVRVVRRSDKAVGEGIEVVSGDAMDPAFVLRSAEGAAVLYHCLNPVYDSGAWQREFPRFSGALVDAAVATGARLVVLDNLYAYGAVAARRTEDSALAPTGPKSQVRADWTRALDEARRTRGLRYTVGKAGDFFGPGTEQAMFSTDVVRGIRAGRTSWLLGDPSQPHAFSYVPDVVRGLAALGTADGVEGLVFHLPVIEVSANELHRRLTAVLGSRSRARAVPRWLLGPLTPFVPVLRELRETLYQWESPFLVDDSRFRTRFPSVGTALDQAVRETAASA